MKEGKERETGVLTHFNYMVLVKDYGIWNPYFSALRVDIILKYKEKSDNQNINNNWQGMIPDTVSELLKDVNHWKKADAEFKSDHVKWS